MKILLVQNAFLGDVVLATPLISALHERYPQAELWMMTTPLASALVKRDPLLKGVISFDKRESEKGFGGLLAKARELKSFGFAKVYSLHKSWRTSLLLRLSGIPERIGFSSARLAFLYTTRKARPTHAHGVQRNLSLISDDIQLTARHPLRLFAPSVSDTLASFLGSSKIPYVVLAPGSAWATKRWDWQEYAKLGSALSLKGFQVVVSGAPDEREICTKVAEQAKGINVAGEITLDDLLSLVKGAHAVVCNDSMTLHLASAFKRPNVAIFCATSPTFGFGPWQNRARVVEKSGLSCKPCARHGSMRCPTGTSACMRQVAYSEVLDAVEELIRPE